MLQRITDALAQKFDWELVALVAVNDTRQIVSKTAVFGRYATVPATVGTRTERARACQGRSGFPAQRSSS